MTIDQASRLTKRLLDISKREDPVVALASYSLGFSLRQQLSKLSLELEKALKDNSDNKMDLFVQIKSQLLMAKDLKAISETEFEEFNNLLGDSI